MQPREHSTESYNQDEFVWPKYNYHKLNILDQPKTMRKYFSVETFPTDKNSVNYLQKKKKQLSGP